MTAAKFRAKFSTAGRVAPIENWLKLNVTGEWSIKMDSISDDMSKKNYLILFEDENDRDSFTRRFTQGKEAYEKKPQASNPGLFNKVAAFFSEPKKNAK